MSLRSSTSKVPFPVHHYLWVRLVRFLLSSRFSTLCVSFTNLYIRDWGIRVSSRAVYSQVWAEMYTEEYWVEVVRHIGEWLMVCRWKLQEERKGIVVKGKGLEKKTKYASFLLLKSCVYDKCITTNVWKIFYVMISEETLRKIKSARLNSSRFFQKKNTLFHFVCKFTSPNVCLPGAYLAILLKHRNNCNTTPP